MRSGAQVRGTASDAPCLRQHPSGARIAREYHVHRVNLGLACPHTRACRERGGPVASGRRLSLAQNGGRAVCLAWAAVVVSTACALLSTRASALEASGEASGKSRLGALVPHVVCVLPDGGSCFMDGGMLDDGGADAAQEDDGAANDAASADEPDSEVAIADAGADAAEASDADASAAGDGGIGDAAADAPTSIPEGGEGAEGGGAGASPGSGGCGCAVVGAAQFGATPHAPGGLLLLGIAIAVRRSRRRAHTGRSHRLRERGGYGRT